MNFFKTSLLLAGMTALFMGLGYLIGGGSGVLAAFAVAAVLNFVSYWNSDKIVLRMFGAREIGGQEEPDLFALVRQLAANAGLPMPRLYLIDNDQPNAFATGRDPDHAAVAVHTGLLQRLDHDELSGVIAHELAHIKNRDTLTMTVTATLAGAISMLAQFGMFFGGHNRGNNSAGPVGMLIAVIVAPLAAMIVQMAVSRTREYAADRLGAEISGVPLALASALRKISVAAKAIPNMEAERAPAMAHLFIVNPLSGTRMDNLFSTHPDVENRIEALAALAQDMRAPPALSESAEKGPWG